MLEALLPGAAASAEESNVCVAVKIRPLVPAEVDDGCRETLFVTPGLPQVRGCRRLHSMVAGRQPWRA